MKPVQQSTQQIHLLYVITNEVCNKPTGVGNECSWVIHRNERTRMAPPHTVVGRVTHHSTGPTSQTRSRWFSVESWLVHQVELDQHIFTFTCATALITSIDTTITLVLSLITVYFLILIVEHFTRTEHRYLLSFLNNFYSYCYLSN